MAVSCSAGPPDATSDTSELNTPVDSANGRQDPLAGAQALDLAAGDETDEVLPSSISGLPEGDAGRYFSNVQGRLGALASDTVYSTVQEALPNVSYVVADGEPFFASDVAVVGRVTSVTSGEAFADDGVDGARVPFDDQTAVWRSFDIGLRVSEVLASSPGNEAGRSDVLTFVVFVDALVDIADVEAALSRGTDVFVIGRYSAALTPGRTDVYVVAHNGGFWFDVAPDETLTARGLPSEFRTALATDGLELGPLRAASSVDLQVSLG